MEYTKKIRYQSNYWYNDGLKKAGRRDLSGAISSLRKSLSYNGSNIDARNLLGLVYYGRGEVSEALVEWILSKNIKAEDNIAGYYINKIQSTPGELDVINGAVKRYNQSIIYCNKGGEDLAVIQLKKAISEHPDFLKAYQLLSLIYINNGQYKAAKPLLKKARKLDTTNEITLSYIHEVSTISSAKVKREEPIDLSETTRIDISDRVTTKVEKSVNAVPQGRYGIKHLVISAIVGALAVAILVIPAMNAGKKDAYNKQLLDYSDRINAMKAQISAQSRALEDYRKNSIDDDGNAKNAVVVKEAYENLLFARKQWEDGTYTRDPASEILSSIDPGVLGTNGAELYESFATGVYTSASASLYESGELAYEKGEYKKAAEYYKRVTDLDLYYREGEALLNLGNTYYKLEEYDIAEQCLKKVIEIVPDSENAGYAEKTIEKIAKIKE